MNRAAGKETNDDYFRSVLILQACNRSARDTMPASNTMTPFHISKCSKSMYFTGVPGPDMDSRDSIRDLIDSPSLMGGVSVHQRRVVNG